MARTKRRKKKPRIKDQNQSATTNQQQGERQSIYFPKEMIEEIKAEAIRQDRSISWIIQKAWRIARPMMKKLPGANDLESDSGGGGGES